MHTPRRILSYALLVVTLALAAVHGAAAADDPLPSWNDGTAKRAIVDFVQHVTTPGGKDFVSEPERIATFDNDGTLWAEQPMYFQFAFALDRVKALAPQHPEWKDQEPFKSLLAGDLKGVLAGGEKAIVQLMMASHAGMTTAEFEQIVKDWLATAKHPRFNRPYTECVYQPMLELLAHLRANGFKTYIVSGGGVEFMRPWTDADGKIEDTGPLTRQRMETVDEEFLAAALDFIDRQHKAGKPFFVYFNSTRMHVFTHLKPESQGKTGLGIYPDGMVEHDGHVGQLLKKLDDLGIANNTIVVYTTDNGVEVMSWPDGGSTPFRGEKATNWEGGFRVPTVIRWPGVIKPGTVYNGMFAHEDLLPTLAAAGGDPDVVARCLQSCQSGNKSFKVHLDGYNLMPFIKGEVKESPRKEFLYWSDDGDLLALRVGDWKIVFKEQLHMGLGV
jgi:hypothetical protein